MLLISHNLEMEIFVTTQQNETKWLHELARDAESTNPPNYEQTGEFVHDFSLSIKITAKMNGFYERKLTLKDR